jgi:glycosyltransferase involved in cell wall biosynthesis
MTEERRAKCREALGIPASAFVAVQSFSLASSLTRKNAIGAISAFVAAFHDQPDARLVLRHLSGDRFPNSLHRLREAAQVAGQQIILRPAGSGLDDLHDLYAACDVYISLHRTEGFGLNLAEVMLAGRPLIATNWSGNLDFMDCECVALVNADLVALSLNTQPIRLRERSYAPSVGTVKRRATRSIGLVGTRPVTICTARTTAAHAIRSS